MTDICATSRGIDDGVPCLNTTMTHPPMPEDATLKSLWVPRSY